MSVSAHSKKKKFMSGFALFLFHFLFVLWRILHQPMEKKMATLLLLLIAAMDIENSKKNIGEHSGQKSHFDKASQEALSQKLIHPKNSANA